MFRKYRPWLKSFSGLFQGLSTAWFSIAFITPKQLGFNNFEDTLILTLDMLFGMLFLVLSVKVEHILEYE
jgi:hypothetical protein